MIIKQPTHKRKTHWFTTLDSLQIIIELFWGDYFAYFWLRWLYYVVPPFLNYDILLIERTIKFKPRETTRAKCAVYQRVTFEFSE